ncbi:MAG TPA: hypothetical protein VGR07_01485 [Thermoanaerobaculia bacterium]|nr:hypothetical protein [Thermoanaerobaculia bacterium]
MSTEATVPTVPAHPAKGNLQGQTTLAAKISRWTGLNNNLVPLLDQMPQFKDEITQFQGVLTQTQALRDRLNILKGQGEEAVKQRDALFAEGDDLFTRLGLALRAVHGPDSSRLRDFGLKPRKKAGGRPKKKPAPAPSPVEVRTSAPGSGGTQEAHGATPAPESVT